MSIRWENIKALKGSQNNAFEELVCQLARQEFQSQGEFIRISAPDGGIEAMCRFQNGSLYGWQAKYFLTSFSSSQWKQIEDSFKEALNNYPNLTKYYVCVATDRGNARISGRKSFLDKWEEHIQKWNEFAKSQNRKIEFEFWGNSELTNLLAKPENSGKKFFWFNENELSEKWFIRCNQQAISNLGVRYTPEINVDLSIMTNLEALARTSFFKEKLSHKFNKLLITINDKSKFLRSYQEVEKYFKHIYDILVKKLDLLSINDLETKVDINLVGNKIRELINYLSDFSKEDLYNHNSYFRDLIDRLRVIIQEVESSNELLLFNGKVLVLTGPAGSGKSHLLGDFVQKLQKSGKFALLLLGQDFTEQSNVWDQIFKQLSLNNTTPDIFLSALNSIGEMQNERVILAIDALNEGVGKTLWSNQLNGLLELVSQYSNIGLVISVRNSYQEIIFNKLNEKNKEKLCYISHTGFTYNEFEAIEVFFTYYGLQLPRSPLLNPEFSNPLYLKLFCESLKKQGKDYIPKGHEGLYNIINSYLDGVETRICEQINEDLGSHLVQRAMNAISKVELELELAENKVGLEYSKARKIIKDELIDDIAESDAKKFLDYLIKENVISKNTYSHMDNEYIYFNYERIGDYQKANLILKYISNQKDFVDWLNTKQGQTLYNRIKNCRGIWEVLSVLLPERFDFELFEVINCSQDKIGFEIIVENLFWRIPNAINKQKLLQFIKNHQCPNLATWINVLFQLSTEINHPLNIRYLHKKLYALSLADRDQFWTTFIVLESNQCSAIDRLLDWCFKSCGQEKIDSQALFLGSIAISWLFTSTDRRSRNKYINALAHLLWNRLEIALQLFKEFKAVNDPYVLEGILSAIYSAIVYSESLSGLKLLAEEIDNQIFNIPKEEEIYPNVLVRDYARHIIEYSLQRDNYSLADIDLIRTRITPPYRSSFPKTLPSNEEIDSKYQSIGQKSIIRSMTTEYGRGTGAYGDFGRYTFQFVFNQWESYSFGNIINVNLLSNYACQIIFEKFGYDENKHSEFDSRNSSRNWQREDTNKIERIGKKYQWLALYEILARVMDNFPAFISNNDESKRDYVRRLDDFLLPKTQIKISPSIKNNVFSQYKNQEQCNNKHYFTFQDNELIEDWVVKNDFPNIGNLLELTINNEKWLALERHDDFRELAMFGQKETYATQSWLQIRSYLLKDSEYVKAKTWLEEQDFMGRWMPEGNDYYGTYLNQFFSENTSKEWKTIYTHGASKQPSFKVIPSVDSHIWESTYGNDGLSFYAPTPIIYHGMEMQNSINDGYWIDTQNNLICFNPEINDKFQRCLLVKKEKFLSFLSKHKFKLVWTVLGEKHSYQKSKLLHKVSGVYYLYGKNKQVHGNIKDTIQEIESWGNEN